MEQTTRLVLLAEDNNDEYIQFMRAVNHMQQNLQVMRVDHGYSLLNMLQTAIVPYAIFLNMNMPYKDGLATLHELREMKQFTHVPVILFSKSDPSVNVDLAFEFGATYFFKKCGDAPRLEALLHYIFDSPYFSQGIQPPRELFYIG